MLWVTSVARGIVTLTLHPNISSLSPGPEFHVRGTITIFTACGMTTQNEELESTQLLNICLATMGTQGSLPPLFRLKLVEKLCKNEDKILWRSRVSTSCHALSKTASNLRFKLGITLYVLHLGQRPAGELITHNPKSLIGPDRVRPYKWWCTYLEILATLHLLTAPYNILLKSIGLADSHPKHPSAR